jgi:hypothetical protein
MDSEKLKKEFEKIKENIRDLRDSKLNPCYEDSPYSCTCQFFDAILDSIGDNQKEILTFYNNQKETNA